MKVDVVAEGKLALGHEIDGSTSLVEQDQSIPAGSRLQAGISFLIVSPRQRHPDE